VSFINQGLTGKAIDAALGDAHITVNMNAVPNDPQSPFVTSGIRVGTPAVTTRGFDVTDCANLAAWMCDICDDFENQTVISEVRIKVAKLCALHPVYEQNK
jgi:glycine hydroxymethyltransferase